MDADTAVLDPETNAPGEETQLDADPVVPKPEASTAVEVVPISRDPRTPVTIYVKDLTSPGTFTPTQLFNTVWSLDYQARYHYNRSPWVERNYSQPVERVRLLEPKAPLPVGAWCIELLDTIDVGGALGYHEDRLFDKNSEGAKKLSGRSSRGLAVHPQTGQEVPLAKIGVATSRDDGVSATEVASHEMLEMLVDPDVMDESKVRKYLDADNREWYIGEVCDAVQGQGYDVESPEGHSSNLPEAVVANFVYPSWYKQAQRRPEFDFCKQLRSPFEIAPQGYMSVAPEDEPDNWSQIYGSAHASGE